MKVFYARVSTEEQNEKRQLKAAEDIGAEKTFVDKASGKNTERAALKEMLNFVRCGDTLYVSDISRLARNTKDLLNIIDLLKEKEVEFVSLKENIDTTTAAGKFMLSVFAAMYELERDNIRERQREGIEIAKAEGKYTGRKPIEINGAEWESVYKEWKEKKITAVEAQKRLELKPRTFYRKVKEYESK